MRITIGEEHISLLKCLSSKTRINIIELLSRKSMYISEISQELGLTPAIVTRYISEMEACKIVVCENVPGFHGIQRRCSLLVDEITVSFMKETAPSADIRKISIPVGQYTSYNVKPTCGLMSVSTQIGLQDDPKYFSSPERINASVLWFSSGYVEYSIPAYAFWQKKVKSMSISLEICSEAPDYNENWPSDIYFYLNGKYIGYWTSPGDFGEKKGFFTPLWMYNCSQYGLLKTIRCDDEGTMIDGEKISNVKISDIITDYNKDITFRIESPANAVHCGGVNIFGKGVGNYDRDIDILFDFE